jgi:serine/threonine-protein kinase
MPQLLPERLLAALRAETPPHAELPADVSRGSRRRVRAAALIGVLAYAVYLAFAPVRLGGAVPLERSLALVNELVGLGLCSALLLVASWRAIPDRAVFEIALVVEVIVCAVVSVAGPWASFVRTGHVFSLSWVVPVIILFPLVVPTPPGRALFVSIVCALTMPAGVLGLAARGLIAVGARDVVAAGVSGAVAVVIAMIAARTVYGAARARAAAESVGSYELLERLGQGGMGEVWRARHAFLARDAAVKLILPQQLQGRMEAREEVVKRFTQEAQLTAGLRSPHTIELFDFGVAADGRLFYAMELLDGLNAEHFVYRFGAVEPRRVVHWLTQACHSLGEAHARGVVHRDLKPANLFLCRFGRDADFVKVLDFGLARPVTETPEQRLTSSGVRLGSPGWMAPEQVFGLPTDARTDVYAMGCVAWWLLAGRKPFEADTAGELMRLHANAPLPLLAEQCAQPVPARLAALVRSCLAKDPGERPADADRLCEALDASVDGARWTVGDAQDWWREHLPGAVGP